MFSSPRKARQDFPCRKAIIVLSILVSLFFLTIVVIVSSVSFYLAFPDGALLTEDEIPWTGKDLIKAYSEPLSGRGPVERPQEWEEVKADVSITEGPESDSGLVDSSTASSNGEWGIDGRGTGSYWMKAGWDGRVKGTSDWSRLYNVTTRPGEKIPRIIHQTWKTDQLPERWRRVWKECREGMPDYEYMLWTDESARAFLEQHYPFFLPTYDSYRYNIQRADAIRYFILYHSGGIYMDTDIQCRRRLDSLLQGDWEVILPRTQPVGISNDLIFSSKGSRFMADAMHGLAGFNRDWYSNYPTVMFSTGPMFLSFQYAMYTSAHSLSDSHQRYDVRILPKILYGKHAEPGLAPHSFFSHFFGASWHADGAGFTAFLEHQGPTVLRIAGLAVALLLGWKIWQRVTGHKSAAGPGYQLLDSALPTSYLPQSLDQSLQVAHSHPSNGEIPNVIKRAGRLILAGPVTLLSWKSARIRQALLNVIPAIFRSTPSSQLPLSVRRRRGSASGIESKTWQTDLKQASRGLTSPGES